MKNLFIVTTFVCICEQCFGMIYPIGDPIVMPTESFSSGNGYIVTQEFDNDIGHTGVDLATYSSLSGGDVRSIFFGTVTYVQNSQATTGWGTMIRIQHQLHDGTVFYSQYSHLLYGSITVLVGSEVREGKVIGKVGNTGYSTNPHLHFEVKKSNTNGCGYLPSDNCPDDSITNYFNSLEFIYLHQVIPGYYSGGLLCQPIIDCFNRLGGRSSVGWPIDDGAGLYVHSWLPFRYICQNFRNADGEESIIMYDPLFGSQAYLISGKFWERYRYGRNGHYGPDMPMDDGKILGCPTSDAKNGIQYFQGGYLKSGSVELRRLDGSLVDIYQPTGEFSSLTLSGIPVSESQIVLAWLGEPVCDYYLVIRDGQQIATVILPEFTEVGLSSGTSYTYQVFAMSNTSGELASSNQIGIVTPGQAGTFTLQGAPEGSSYVYLQWQNSLYNTNLYWLYRNGVLVAKTTASAFSDFPLEPNTAYTYQVSAVTFSGLVFGWSNPVTVSTDPAPPKPPTPDPVATSVQIQLEQTWVYAAEGRASATVFDQYGSEIPGVRVLFFSSEPSVFVVSGDNGYCIANNIGTAEVWVEVADRRYIKSERVSVEVMAEILPEQIQFESSPLMLDCNLELLASPPFIEYQQISLRVYLSNPTDQPITFYGPRGFSFKEDGSLFGCSSYSSTAKILNPGESAFYVIYGVQLPSAGHCFINALTCPQRSIIDSDWQLIDQTAIGVSSTLCLNVISQSDLKAELSFWSLMPVVSEFFAGDDLIVKAGIINSGDVNITTSFLLTVGLAGQSSQSCEIPSLPCGEVNYQEFNLGKLSEGNYKIDAISDAGGVISEYDESDNVKSIIVEVLPKPTQPNSVITQASYSPSQIYAGKTIAISFTVVNSGTAIMPTQTVAVVLGQEVFGTVTVPALAIGQSFNGQISFDSQTAWRSVTFTVLADKNNAVAEENESDNSKTLAVVFLAPGDDWDPNDDIVSNATALNNPQTTEQTHGLHTLSGVDSYDWFKVYLAKNVRYNLNTVGGSGDTYGELYSDSAGKKRVAYNDNGGGNLQFSLTYKPSKAGWYYLRIRSFVKGGNCSYALNYRKM